MSISFAKPAILFLLLLLPLLVVVKALANRWARQRVAAAISPRLIGRLVVGRRPSLAGTFFALELVALGCFMVALARPQYGYVEKEIEGEGRTLIVAVDTSRSMLAQDLAPNRLQRALLAARDLVLALPDDRIGIIAFAGRAFVQAPLTIDHAAVLETLSQLDTEIISRGGTNLSEAIELAVKTFDKSESANHALILFTDGDELEGDALAAARSAADKNVMIITIGVGTRTGTVIPDSRTRGARRDAGSGFVVDSNGKVVRSQLESGKLEQLARETRGLYLRLDSGEIAGALVKKALENLDKAAMVSERTRREPVERYRWPLFTGVVLLLGVWVGMLGINRGEGKGTASRVRSGGGAAPGSAPVLGVLVPVLMLCSLKDVSAGLFGETDPHQALADGNHTVAIDGFTQKLERAPHSRLADEWRFARGSAAFRHGDFEQSIEDFGSTLLSEDDKLVEQSHYNLATAIAAKAKLRSSEAEMAEVDFIVPDIEDAIAHYDAAIELNTENADALANRAALMAFLKQLQQSQQEAEEEQEAKAGQSGAEQQGQGKAEGGEGQSGNSDQPSTSDGAGEGQGSPGENKDEGEGNSNNEQGEGMEGEGDRDRDEKERDGEDESKLEGELKAVKQEDGHDGPPQQRDARPGGAVGDQERNPRTGFSPSEARQLLRALADEDRNVRPTYGRPQVNRNYKDW